MKTKLTILFFILTISFIGQNSNSEIKGQWKGCDKESGYFEMIVSDSLIYQIDSRTGGFSSIPFNYTYKNNNVSLFYPNDSLNSITFYLQVIDKNTLIRKYDGKKADTLKLLDKSTPHDNINRYCEFEMTPSQYNDYLISQFWERVIMNQHKCVAHDEFYYKLNAKKQVLFIVTQ